MPPGQSGSKTAAAAAWIAAAFKDDVGAPAAGQIVHHLNQILFSYIHRRDRPQRRGQIQLGLLHVGDDHLAAAAGQRGQRRHHADGPGAGDHGHVARLDARLDGGVHAHGQRLDHGALGKAHVVGQLEGEAAGCTTVGRSTPWMGGVAQKRTAGSRL